MLAAGAAGTIGVDSDIIRINFNIDIILQIRHHITGHEGSLPLSRRIKGRNPHQAMYAMLGT